MPETVFQESAAKVAIGFFSEIKIFENTAFGHVTEVPTSESFRFPTCNFIKKDILEDVFL